MLSPEDEFFQDFHQPWEGIEEHASTVSKKIQIISAVIHNEVDTLQRLLEPKFYKTWNKSGYTLLQIAILKGGRGIFNYLLSLLDFPFDDENEHGETALLVALGCASVSPFSQIDEFYSLELLRKGARVDVTCSRGNNPLYYVRGHFYNDTYTNVTKLLLEKGVDIHACSDLGDTPIDLAASLNNEELVVELLVRGAVPSFKAFKYCAKRGLEDISEYLFYHIFDEFFHEEVSLDLILQLAVLKFPLYNEFIKYCTPVYFKDELDCFMKLFYINCEYLEPIMENWRDIVRQVLIAVEERFEYRHFLRNPIKNLNLMLESDLREDVVSLLSSNNHSTFHFLIHNYEEPLIIEIYYFCASYGLNIVEEDLQKIYKKFGFSEAFKTLLHMDITMDLNRHDFTVPRIFFDMTLDFDQVYKDPHKLSTVECENLMPYFGSPVLREKCGGEGGVLGRVPCLIELARNKIRKFLIEKYKIKTSSRFYAFLRHLRDWPICKLISFEKKLY